MSPGGSQYRRYRRQSQGAYPEAALQRVKHAFHEGCLEFGACQCLRRAQQIAALPTVEWKGRTYHTVRCLGLFGRGPHDVNLPESVLWALTNVRVFYCPFHR